MASLQTYISQLTTFRNNIPKMVNTAIAGGETEIIDAIHERFDRTGLDANLSPIGGGYYSENYALFKRSIGMISNHVTLEYTGDFRSKYNIFVQGGMSFIGSSDSKTSMLENRYWYNDLFGLTKNETDAVVEDYVDPFIQEEINKLPKVIDI